MQSRNVRNLLGFFLQICSSNRFINMWNNWKKVSFDWKSSYKSTLGRFLLNLIKKNVMTVIYILQFTMYIFLLFFRYYCSYSLWYIRCQKVSWSDRFIVRAETILNYRGTKARGEWNTRLRHNSKYHKYMNVTMEPYGL